MSNNDVLASLEALGRCEPHGLIEIHPPDGRMDIWQVAIVSGRGSVRYLGRRKRLADAIADAVSVARPARAALAHGGGA